MKRCGKCGEVKSFSEFNKCSATQSGLHAWCRECQSEYRKQYYANDPEKWRRATNEWRTEHPHYRREYERKYPERCREQYRRYGRLQRQRYPQKAKARWAIARDVQHGKIIKPSSCQRCGEPYEAAKLHGHHEDYSRLYDVIWLCDSCHKRLHFIAQESTKNIENIAQ